MQVVVIAFGTRSGVGRPVYEGVRLPFAKYMLKLPLLKAVHIEYALVPDIATSFKTEFTFPRLLLMLIGSLKILPASILPTKNISKWEFVADVDSFFPSYSHIITRHIDVWILRS